MSNYNTYLKINADSVSPYLKLSKECFGITEGLLSLVGIHVNTTDRMTKRTDSEAFASDWATVGADWWNVISSETNG